MRLKRISGIIKAEVCVAEADNTNNSSYPTRTEFNNCFIICICKPFP